MSSMNTIKEIISGMPAGAVFSAKNFRRNATEDNIKKILSRLAQEKIIIRTARGIYQKPKIIEGVSYSHPSIREVISTIAEASGETIIPHGSEAARQLNLTTQVPMKLIFHTNGASRKIKIGNHTVELRHTNPSRIIAPNSTAGTAISALLYLGRSNVSYKTIDTIRSQISEEDFLHLMDEVENMPAWLASIFFQYEKENKQ